MRKNENTSMREWFGSMIVFTAIVCAGIWWVGNNMTFLPTAENNAATTTAKIAIGLPDVVLPSKIAYATLDKTAFPIKNADVAKLLDATAKYPSNTPFAERVKKHVDNFITSFISDYPTSADIVTSVGVEADSSVTFSHGKKLLSYMYEDYRFDGGAHGNSTYTTETYDMNGKQYDLADLFISGAKYLTPISKLAIAHFSKDPDLQFNPADPIFGSGLDPTIENYAVFTVTDTSLIFQFQSYQIGPYSDGAPSFEVSLNDPTIKPILRQELFK